MGASSDQKHPEALEAMQGASGGEYVREGGSRSADEVDALLAISRSLSGELDLERVLAASLSIVGGLLGADGASILLIDPESQAMRFFVAQGPGTDAIRTLPLPPGEGICGHVARTGRPVIVNDAQHDPRLYRQADQASGVVTRNLIAVPIRSKARLWGVLELINKQGGAGFSAQDLRLAEVVGTQTALSLENAHLHGEIVRNERMAAIGQTVSGLAHCIKNILNGIRSGSTVVDRAIAKSDLERIRAGWETVRRNNEMLNMLVLDMLALARDTTPRPFPTDINDLAEQITRLVADRAAEQRVKLTCQPAPGLPEVLVDPTYFYRSLLNLVANAIDACQAGSHVCVRVYRAPNRDRLTVSVADNGAGMSKETQRKLFTEFFTTKGGRGTGLGLPVTRKLVGEMGGTIKFHSVPGAGTHFVFTVPIAEATGN